MSLWTIANIYLVVEASTSVIPLTDAGVVTVLAWPCHALRDLWCHVVLQISPGDALLVTEADVPGHVPAGGAEHEVAHLPHQVGEGQQGQHRVRAHGPRHHRSCNSSLSFKYRVTRKAHSWHSQHYHGTPDTRDIGNKYQVIVMITELILTKKRCPESRKSVYACVNADTNWPKIEGQNNNGGVWDPGGYFTVFWLELGLRSRDCNTLSHQKCDKLFWVSSLEYYITWEWLLSWSWHDGQIYHNQFAT